MSEAAIACGLHLGALLVSLAGMGWLALSMPVHAQQVWGRMLAARTARGVRALGASGLAVSLALCLGADHASMAALVWIMSLAAAALTIAFTLAWRSHWLGLLLPWVHRQDQNKRGSVSGHSGNSPD
jgi:urea transporter